MQTHIGRTRDTAGATSRDRIRQLEDSVGRLWGVVRALRTELGHTHSLGAQDDEPDIARELGDDDDEASESSDSPINAPTHLRQLFNNEILDSHGNDYISPDRSPDQTFAAVYVRARTRLQALMPSKDDLIFIAQPTAKWLEAYNTVFPRFTMFGSVDEIIGKYDELQLADANPVLIAALLLWFAMGVQHSPPHALPKSIMDGPALVQKVSDAVEDVIVRNDTLAGSVEGIETSLLWTRL